ncbi:MAG TPA: RagB/SusD family nutrient uptake outer membrane protein, partial [Chitinophagaceae bacterium]
SDQPDVNPLETWAYNANNPYLNEKWVNNYDGIGRANETLRMIPQATDLTADEVKRITAEARFLRGWFHFELKKVFANIPFVDETITVDANNTNVSNIDGGGYVNIWPQIEDDLKFAADNLPETQPQAGRINKWGAMAYLAKVYLYQDKYDLAKPLFDQVIASGTTTNGKKYALVNYFSNFNPDQDNSAESVFAYQASVNDGSGTNGNYGDNLNYPNSGGPGGCCGFFNPSITLANAFKTDANGLPLLDTYNSGNSVGAPTSPYVGTVDPRLDLTVGRKGIPFLDWGPHPGDAWIRDPGVNGWMSAKKTVYAKSQTNIVSNETSFWGPTQMDAGNVNLMRFSDVLLMAAEAEVEVGTTAKALEYVNMVRARAADTKGWVYKNSEYDAATATYKTQTTPADNYKVSPYPAGAFTDKAFARKAIMFERFIELGQEGHRFFDLQRWDNGTGLMANTLNAYAAIEKNRSGFFSINKDANFEKGKDEIYPLPQSQVDQANSYGPEVLKQNPGY